MNKQTEDTISTEIKATIKRKDTNFEVNNNLTKIA